MMEKQAVLSTMPHARTCTSLPQLNAALRLTQPPPLLLPFASLGEVGVKRRADG